MSEHAQMLQIRRTDTNFAPFPWTWEPPHTTRHLTLHARLRRRRNRFMASAFVADLRGGWLNKVLPVIGAVGIVYGFIVFLRGAYIAALLVSAAVGR
jgi:hypothetical protein